MATSQKAIRRAMLALAPRLGRSEAVTALATGSVTAGSLAYGGSPQRYIDRWAVRGDSTAAADKIRRISNFTASTGLMAHTGANYSDTTSTSEIVEIWEVDPQLADNAIQVTLPRLKRLDRTELPTVQNQRRVWLDDCNWITEPGDVTRVCWSDNPVRTKNRYFQKWNSYNSSGVLAPDSWTLSGSGATMARSSTQTFRGLPNSLAITRAGTDAELSQTSGLLENGVSAENLRGESVTAVFWVWSSTASQVRARIYDGVTTSNGSYHTGGSGWEELTVTATIGSTATTVECRLSVETSNNVVYVNEGYDVEASSLTDDVRRDNWEEHPLDRTDFVDAAGTLSMALPERARRGQWVIYSQRGYPQLDATRFAANTSEADVIDADVTKVATGAIARLYEALAAESREKYGGLAREWGQRFEALALGHASDGQGMKPGGAMAAVWQPLAPAARSW